MLLDALPSATAWLRRRERGHATAPKDPGDDGKVHVRRARASACATSRIAHRRSAPAGRIVGTGLSVLREPHSVSDDSTHDWHDRY